MRHQIKLIAVCLLLFACLLIPIAAKPDVTYFSLKHPVSYSPDCLASVMIVEDRYVSGSLYCLTLLVVDPRDGTQNFGMYVLTPNYKEVVAIPGSTHFAYLQYDPLNAHSIHVFMPETGDQIDGITYGSSGRTITQLQASKDGKYLCFFLPHIPHPYASASTKKEYQIRRHLQNLDENGWNIKIADGSHLSPEDQIKLILLSKAEKDAFTEWAPIEKPSVIPQIFTQPMPTITLDTKVQWSPDSNYLYVSDDTGIWCVSLRTPLPKYVPMWTKLVKAERIHRFQLSPTGTHLVYEVRPDLTKRTDEEQKADPFGLENEIWLVDLAPFFAKKPKPDPLEWESDVTEDLSPTKIAKGWGATFNPNGKSTIYSNTEETNIISLETLKHHLVDWSAKQ